MSQFLIQRLICLDQAEIHSSSPSALLSKVFSSDAPNTSKFSSCVESILTSEMMRTAIIEYLHMLGIWWNAFHILPCLID